MGFLLNGIAVGREHRGAGPGEQAGGNFCHHAHAAGMAELCAAEKAAQVGAGAVIPYPVLFRTLLGNGAASQYFAVWQHDFKRQKLVCAKALKARNCRRRHATGYLQGLKSASLPAVRAPCSRPSLLLPEALQSRHRAR